MRRFALAALLVAAPLSAQTPAPAKRALRATDLYRLRNVIDPQLSPDGAWVAYTLSAIDSAKDKKTPKPIVIDRYQYKRDVTGYLETKRSHLSLFDLDTKKVQPLTAGLDEDDASATWSPDGKRIAFVRTPTREPAQVENSDL